MARRWVVAGVTLFGLVAAGMARADVVRVIDLTGTLHEIGQKPVAVVFLGTECPISNRYVPTLNTIAKGPVPLVGVVSDSTATRRAVEEWVRKYAVAFPVVLDASGDLARRLAPTHTPEAFVLGRDGSVVYRGRIDDAWAGLGRPKEVVTSHDLSDAIAAVSDGREIKTARTPSVGCTFEPESAGVTSGKVTYARDVAPILYANCVECHRPGQAAPFSLMTYADAAKRVALIADVTGSRYMPPWKPVPGYGHFEGERGLSDSQVATIQRWAKDGAPEGDPADLPKLPEFKSGWALGEPDVVITMPEVFEVPASGKDVYRAFVVPSGVTEDTEIVACEFRPGNPKVVHHALLYLDDTQKARQLDAADPAPGYKSFGGPGFTPSGGLGGWAPGAAAQRLPEGMGRPIHKDADVVFQMHYHPDGKVESDRSQLALYFAKTPVSKYVGSVAMGRRTIDIAPGDGRYVLRQTITAPQDLMLIGIIPHMHLIGRQMKVTATSPDGSVTPLIWIKDWDFQWQGQYQYATPMVLKKGTRVDMEAVYDNSADNPANPSNPPKRVTFGEQTTDEMCYCFLQVAVGGRDELRRVNRAIVAQQLAKGIADRLAK